MVFWIIEGVSWSLRIPPDSSGPRRFPQDSSEFLRFLRECSVFLGVIRFRRTLRDSLGGYRIFQDSAVCLRVPQDPRGLFRVAPGAQVPEVAPWPDACAPSCSGSLSPGFGPSASEPKSNDETKHNVQKTSEI